MSEQPTPGPVAKSRRKLYVSLVAVPLLLYVATLLFYFVVMLQPPATLAKVIDKTPMPVFMVMPMVPMWNMARGGDLEPGDLAPDFELSFQQGGDTAKLSAFRDDKPVVLVFGSYT